MFSCPTEMPLSALWSFIYFKYESFYLDFFDILFRYKSKIKHMNTPIK